MNVGHPTMRRLEDQEEMFPPQLPESEWKRAEELLTALQCSTDKGNTTYCAGPITSGRARSVESTEKLLFKKNNIELGRAKAARLRGEMSGSVIEPFSLSVDDWSQNEYRAFWRLVIERLCDRVLFLDDWQYSNGASFEFLVATNSGKLTLDERGQELSRAEGTQKIREAITDLTNNKLSTEFLCRILSHMENTKGKVSL